MLDYVGCIPYLLAVGFTGVILCSEPSATLLPIVLANALSGGRIAEDDLKAAFVRCTPEITWAAGRKFYEVGAFQGFSLLRESFGITCSLSGLRSKVPQCVISKPTVGGWVVDGQRYEIDVKGRDYWTEVFESVCDLDDLCLLHKFCLLLYR